MNKGKWWISKKKGCLTVLNSAIFLCGAFIVSPLCQLAEKEKAGTLLTPSIVRHRSLGYGHGACGWPRREVVLVRGQLPSFQLKESRRRFMAVFHFRTLVKAWILARHRLKNRGGGSAFWSGVFWG